MDFFLEHLEVKALVNTGLGTNMSNTVLFAVTKMKNKKTKIKTKNLGTILNNCYLENKFGESILWNTR